MACALLLAAGCSPALAETPSVKGMASVPYQRKLDSGVRQQALASAKLNALERYVADSNAARMRVFDEKRTQIAGAVDSYILGATVLSESDDKDAHTYSVVIRADVNGTRLQNALGASASAPAASQGQGNLITFLFMARMQDSVKSFQDRVYQRADVHGSGSHASNKHEQTTESESIGASSIGTGDRIRSHTSERSDSTMVVESGGSVTRKADKIDWTVTPSSEINTAMTGVFSDAGFQVVEAEYVESESHGLLSIAAVRKDFSKGDELAPATMRNTANGVRAAGIGYLAEGTLDVGIRDTDPVSGNVRVFVTVTGKVLDVGGRFPRTLSSVGPVQYAGLGPTETVARTNALKLAAESAARQMADELTAKGIR
ncbi:hypothetical protein [Cognatiluteimonas profundi]|uniref:hypothetical protein n=1 Tax=Cognatiluteimonas profundi TaxID=2594501 RepID=UPI001E2D31DA|nr:hypothetical protein [Lysobacter profundi]